MGFREFISSLNDEEKKNYYDYSKIRGEQQYRIIYETLLKIDSNVTWNDVNAFVIFDKAIKDTLFKYLENNQVYDSPTLYQWISECANDSGISEFS